MSVGLPLHVNELRDIEPQLSSLLLLYKIDAVSFVIVLCVLMDLWYRKASEITM